MTAFFWWKTLKTLLPNSFSILGTTECNHFIHNYFKAQRCADDFVDSVCAGDLCREGVPRAAHRGRDHQRLLRARQPDGEVRPPPW